MADSNHSEVLELLERDENVSERAQELVLAAMLGEVEECLGGKVPSAAPSESAEDAAPVRAYIDSVLVQGFRGIGPGARLELVSGPGLTLVVGRNGSGKSSFAEALELVLTGANQRWSSKRSSIWRDGWRNLHQADKARIEARLLIDGEGGPYVVTREWTAKDALEAGEAAVSHNGTSTSVAQLGWALPLATYRPFLSYNELGSMLEDAPSKLSDALGSILGLEELSTAAEALKEARTSRTKAHKKVKDKLVELRALLEDSPDDRAAKAFEALKGTKWNLDAVESLIAGDGVASQDTTVSRLRTLTQLEGPKLDVGSDAVSRLRQAITEQQSIAGTDADRARRRADILEKALELHRHQGDGDCPVCGSSSALNESWHQQAKTEAESLRKEAEAAENAERALRAAEQAARAIITAAPQSLVSAQDLGVEGTTDAQSAWRAWQDGATQAGEDLAGHVEKRGPELHAALQLLREQSRAKLQELEDVWRPVALALAQWLPGARRMLSEADTLAELKKAEDWIRRTATTLRNERFEPIKEKVKGIWELLRTRSNVELEDVTFEGKATSRKVNLDVTVDGTRGAALGVMSQGELHSLALALFLPRATLEASPFKFLVIDDPVQSMDPARVDGLAKVLGEVAQNRQVIVFTHDDRLPDAVRRLKMPARIIEVLRREGSVVELREVQSPMQQYLADAFALVMTKDLPKVARERVVPGLCRHSLEAACLDVVRRRRLARGDSHESIEELFDEHAKLVPRLALALFDDAEKTGDVYTSIKKRFGPWQVDTVKLCNQGAHKGFPQDDPLSFVRNVEKLGKQLAELQ